MKNRISGFTLVELMVVVVVVGVVVLLFTQIPLFGLSSWRKGSERLKMQRDAHYVMIKIQHELRPADEAEVSILNGGDALEIDNKKFFVDKDGQSGFFNDLVQESGGVKEQVVEGDSGTTFQVAMAGANVVTMTLTLVRGNVQTTLTTAVKPRN